MATTQVVGARTSLPFTGAATLASATYVRNTTAYDCSANNPVDVIVEVGATTTNTPSGTSPQIVAFIQESLDGTNFRSGPTSGTTTTRERNLKWLGVLPMTTASTPELATFSVFAVLGYVPKKFYVVLKNEVGVALTACTVWTAEISIP